MNVINDPLMSYHIANIELLIILFETICKSFEKI